MDLNSLRISFFAVLVVLSHNTCASNLEMLKHEYSEEVGKLIYSSQQSFSDALKIVPALR